MDKKDNTSCKYNGHKWTSKPLQGKPLEMPHPTINPTLLDIFKHNALYCIVCGKISEKSKQLIEAARKREIKKGKQ